MQLFDTKDIVEYSDFFEKHDHISILRSIDDTPWYWGHKSIQNKENRLPPFWYMGLSENKFFSQYLLNKIEQKTNCEFHLERVYANGQNYGMRGSPHQDGFDASCRTLLYYPMETWNVEWGGKTGFIIQTNSGPKYHFVVPEPNKAVLFPGQIFHWAEETTRSFAGLRITIAWKLFIKIK